MRIDTPRVVVSSSVRGEPIAERGFIGLEKRPDLVKWQFECPQAANGDGVLDLRRAARSSFAPLHRLGRS